MSSDGEEGLGRWCSINKSSLLLMSRRQTKLVLSFITYPSFAPFCRFLGGFNQNRTQLEVSICWLPTSSFFHRDRQPLFPFTRPSSRSRRIILHARIDTLIISIMYFTSLLAVLLQLALLHLTVANPAGRPVWHKRYYTNETTTSTSVVHTGAYLVARGTGTGGAYLVPRGTGTGGYLLPSITGKPAFSKRQFTNTTTTSTTAANTGAYLVPRGTGTAPYLVPRGTGTGLPWVYV